MGIFNKRRPLVTIILASNRPANLREFLAEVVKKTYNPAALEVCVILDEGDEECSRVIAEAGAALPLKIISKAYKIEHGYFGLNVPYEDMYKRSSGYFVTVWTDEIRVKTEQWDRAVERLQGFYDAMYPDGIYRLKISYFRRKNYYDLAECMSHPECYPLATRRWMDCAGGIGDLWAPDAWHQAIEYFMGFLANKFFPHGFMRGIAIDEIEICGQDAGKMDSEAKQKVKNLKITEGWKRFLSHRYQLKYAHIATRMMAFATLFNRYGSENFMIGENEDLRRVAIIDKRDNVQIDVWEYAVPHYQARMYIGERVVGTVDESVEPADRMGYEYYADNTDARKTA